ncbi:hypothetical protein Sked_28180 [Sanguibacter keddieii DSM 10542]|uniref:Septum formation-related domain-containing protein n=1 Tax=Sanguibacter keddieii (strain ATCC 51767 / DSM 10542 / NCFB 3025 / ST-74) TaxID=446469 RepID=D1BB19_SANKS|nr:hypothetical protein [Sanguibacter keddieii]ACZ22720.1 hypothetical protein Sked_28180 [Sanguibacter keddieii DSM 10542]
MLTAPDRWGRLTLVLALAAVALAACSDGPGAADGSNPLGVDEGTISLVPFDEITTTHCLGSSYPVDGMAQTVACGEPGAVEISAVTVFGPDAPPAGSTPPTAVVGGYAEAACDEHHSEWLVSKGLEGSSLLRVATYPDEWSGPGTPLVCGARA